MAKNIVERRANPSDWWAYQKMFSLVIAGKCRLKLWDNGIQSGWQERAGMLLLSETKNELSYCW